MHHPYNPHHHSGVHFLRFFFIVLILTITILAVYISTNIPVKKNTLPTSTPTPNYQAQDYSYPQDSTSSGKIDTPTTISGPGGCSSLEDCLKYCDSHPTECNKRP